MKIHILNKREKLFILRISYHILAEEDYKQSAALHYHFSRKSKDIKKIFFLKELQADFSNMKETIYFLEMKSLS